MLIQLTQCMLLHYCFNKFYWLRNSVLPALLLSWSSMENMEPLSIDNIANAQLSNDNTVTAKTPNSSSVNWATVNSRHTTVHAYQFADLVSAEHCQSLEKSYLRFAAAAWRLHYKNYYVCPYLPAPPQIRAQFRGRHATNAISVEAKSARGNCTSPHTAIHRVAASKGWSITYGPASALFSSTTVHYFIRVAVNPPSVSTLSVTSATVSTKDALHC